MKTLRATLLLASLSGGFSLAEAQTAAMPPPTPATSAPVPDGVLMTAEQLEQLLGPIALYPDALIALVLPACTAPTDIVLAARQLRDSPEDRSQIEHRGWDESVKSLTSFPEVLRWLDENLTWTKQVGEAFVEQPAEVMQAVQRLRAKARAAGTLVDTPQQQVIAESNTIRIVPAQPEVIYVPYYEPEVVFVSTPVYYSRPVLAFGTGVAVGSWLAYDCDWNRRVIWCGDRRRPWHGHDWRRPVVSYAPPASTRVSITVRQWRPPPVHVRPSRPPSFTYRHADIVRPAPIGRPSGFTQSPRPTGPRPGGSSFAANSSTRVDPPPLPSTQPPPRLYTRDRDRDGNRGGDRDRSSPPPAGSQRLVQSPQYTQPAPQSAAPQVQAQPQPQQRLYTQPRSRGSNSGQAAYTAPSPSSAVAPAPAPSYAPAQRHHDRNGSTSFAARSSSRVAPPPVIGPTPIPSTTPTPPQPSVSTTPPPQQRGNGDGGNNSSRGSNGNNGSPGAGRGRDWRNNER